MRWLELTVETHPEAIESVSELLSQYTPGGVAIEEPFELIDEGQEYRVLVGQPVKVHGYLPVDGAEEDALLVMRAIPERMASALSNEAETSMPFLVIENSRSDESPTPSRSLITEINR